MGGDGGAGGGVGGAAEELAVRAVDEGVAAFEDAQGAEGFEARGGAVEAGVGLLEGDGAGRPEALLEGLEVVAVVGEAEGDVLAAETGFELGEARVVVAEGAVEGGFGAVGEVVEVLGCVACAANDGVWVDGGDALAEAEKVVAAGAGEAGLQPGEAVGDAVLGVGEELGGGGGGWGRGGRRLRRRWWCRWRGRCR